MESLSLAFTRTNTVHDDRRPYTVYEITCSTKLTHSWVVWKRYNMFHTFHQELTKALQFYPKTYVGVKLPPLPPKKFNTSLVSEFVDKRKAELAEYMKAILAIPSLLHSKMLIEFLEVPETFRPLFVANDEQDALDTSSSDDEGGRHFHMKSREDKMIFNLLRILSSPSHVLRNKVAALKTFENYFFDERPHLTANSISILLEGRRGNDRGLIQSCGDFKYSHIASSASLHLLCRLLDIEKNKDAEMFLDQVVKVDPAVLRQMQLRYHIIEEKGNRLNAFRLIDMLSTYDRDNEALSVENIVTDAYARDDYERWEQRQSASFPERTYDSIISTSNELTLSEVAHEYKVVSAQANANLYTIATDDKGWISVPPLNSTVDEKRMSSPVFDKFVDSLQLSYRHPTGERKQASIRWNKIRTAYTGNARLSDDEVFSMMRVTCTLPVKIDQVQALLSSVKKRRLWDLKCHRGKLLETLDDDQSSIVQWEYKSFSSPYKYRDVCVLRHVNIKPDGTRVLSIRSVDHANAAMEDNDVIRCRLFSSGCVLRETADKNGTDLIMILQLDAESAMVYASDILGESDDVRNSMINLYNLLL